MSQLVEQIMQVYREFSPSSLAALPDVYAEDATFIDPVHTLEGLPSIRRYFEAMAKGLDTCHFDFSDVDVNGERAFLTWKMVFQHRRLGNKVIEVDGLSTLRFDEKVKFHRDYYDLGEMLYEHVPVLGFCLKQIKKGVGASAYANS